MINLVSEKIGIDDGRSCIHTMETVKEQQPHKITSACKVISITMIFCTCHPKIVTWLPTAGVNRGSNLGYYKYAFVFSCTPSRLQGCGLRLPVTLLS